jgi:hypothetical protein
MNQRRVTTKSVEDSLKKHLVVAAASQVAFEQFERQPDTECAASRALAGSTCIAAQKSSSVPSLNLGSETINAIIGFARIRSEAIKSTCGF